MSNAVALRPPPLNRLLCEVMRRDLDQALLAIRAIGQIEASSKDAAEAQRCGRRGKGRIGKILTVLHQRRRAGTRTKLDL